MEPGNSLLERYHHCPSSRLLGDALRLPIEQAVSEHYQIKWQVKEFFDMHDFASHPSAVLSDGNLSVFIKLSEAKHGVDQFEAEMAGLKLLGERAGVLTPALVALISVPAGVILVIEAVEAVERTAREWREMGRTLARIHQVNGSFFGSERQGYFGPLFQDNRPLLSWIDFFLERRLWPRLTGAIDSGCLPSTIIHRVESLIARLPGLEIPEARPVLLHGDAQQNNFISTANGTMVIDPAVYYGHPEVDLALVDYFQPVPEDVFDGYSEIMPIDPGFRERRDLWRIPAYLAAVQVEGAGHLFRLEKALDQYL
jgi:protein-ribulosamine 3-kinase